MRFAIKFAYDGTKFSGSQRQTNQDNVRTVEGEILQCLLEQQVVPDQKKSKLQLASRTDAGVSALGNVMALDTDFELEEVLSILNSKLGNCWFWSAVEVDSEFNPKFAKLRWYRYHLFNYDEHFLTEQKKNNVKEKIDIEKLSIISKQFMGKHDFTNFAKPQLDDTVRAIDTIDIEQKDNWLYIDIKAQSFLWNQIRRMLSAWLKFVQDEVTFNELVSALNAPDSSAPHDFGLAAPEPLVLMDVQYDFEFRTDRRLLKKTRKRILNQWRKVMLKQNLLDYLLKEV